MSKKPQLICDGCNAPAVTVARKWSGESLFFLILGILLLPACLIGIAFIGLGEKRKLRVYTCSACGITYTKEYSQVKV